MTSARRQPPVNRWTAHGFTPQRDRTIPIHLGVVKTPHGLEVALRTEAREGEPVCIDARGAGQLIANIHAVFGYLAEIERGGQR